MTKPHAGRNELGQFATNDATISQFAEAIIAAMDVLAAGRWMHKEQQAEYDGHMATARIAAGLTDAGERPATEVATE